jgi:hypothetical protein
LTGSKFVARYNGERHEQGLIGKIYAMQKGFGSAQSRWSNLGAILVIYKINFKKFDEGWAITAKEIFSLDVLTGER